MTLIYCLKCRARTETISQDFGVSTNGRNRVFGKCAICGTKKNLFVNNNGEYIEKPEKTAEEKAEAERKRKELAFDRRAYRLGMKLLQSESEGCVKRCVKKCIAKKKA